MLDTIATPAYFGQLWIKRTGDGIRRYTLSGIRVNSELWAIADHNTGVLTGVFTKGTTAADTAAAMLRADGWIPLSELGR